MVTNDLELTVSYCIVVVLLWVRWDGLDLMGLKPNHLDLFWHCWLGHVTR